MRGPGTGSIRLVRHAALRAVAALAMALALVGVPSPATPGAVASGAGWYDGTIKYSTITNCASIIFGNPYLENGAGAYVGFYADPNTSQPAVNQTYYVHIVIYGLGNACAGQYAWPSLVLPANTSLAITGGNPVYCFGGGVRDTVNCPQSLPYNAVNGGYSILPTGGGFWPLPQGGSWEWQIPVKSSTTLSGSQMAANIVMADGNSNPTLTPTQGVFVFSGTGSPKPAIVYPNPSTDSITRTSAISYANIYTAGLAGNVHFQLGTTKEYGLYESSFHLTAGTVNWSLYDDWTPTVLTPDTLYHFRMWFDPDDAGVANVYGADQTFRTLGAATAFTVSGMPSGSPAGTSGNVTVTAKDATGTTATTYRGTIHFTSDDTAAGLPADYTFTAGDNGSHTFTGVRLFTAGTREIRARDVANSSITGAQTGISVTTTISPPTATIGSLPAWKAATGVAVKWGGGGATSYDVQVRRAPWSGGFGAASLWKSAVTGTSATYAGKAGSTYCFSARSRSAQGAVSAWTSETCTAVPLDDRSLTKSGSWTKGTGSAYYKGTYMRSTSKGAKLTRTGVVAKRIAIVATTCPTCGKVSVYLGSTLLKTVSLVSSTTKNKRLITVATLPEVSSGTITLKVATSGKKVVIDGLVVSAT